MKLAKWQEKVINIKESQENTQYAIVFKGIEDPLNPILRVNKSCSCVSAIISRLSNEVSIEFKFKVGTIPYHLKEQGYSLFEKAIYVVYSHKQVEKLSVRGKIVSKDYKQNNINSMKKYVGVKVVDAAPMDYKDAVVEGLIRDPKPDHNEEGYKIVYKDGYQSWSPKLVFDEAYRVLEL